MAHGACEDCVCSHAECECPTVVEHFDDWDPARARVLVSQLAGCPFEDVLAFRPGRDEILGLLGSFRVKTRTYSVVRTQRGVAWRGRSKL